MRATRFSFLSKHKKKDKKFALQFVLKFVITEPYLRVAGRGAKKALASQNLSELKF